MRNHFIVMGKGRFLAQKRRFSGIGWIVAVLWLSAPTTGQAKPLEFLTATLLRHESYKVRLQAALVLSRLRNRNAYTAFTQCLRFDSHHLVRSVCATALGRLGLIKAKKPLSEALKDRHKYVRQQAQKALKALGATRIATGPRRNWKIPPRRHARYFVRLGSMSKSNRVIHRSYCNTMREGFWDSLTQKPKVEVGYAADKPPRKYLKRYRLKAYSLEASLVRLKTIKNGSHWKVLAKVRVTLVKYPTLRMMLVTSATAAASQGVRGSLNENQRRGLCHRLKVEAIRNATHAVATNVWQYLKSK